MKYILIPLFFILIVPYLLRVIGRFLLGSRPRQGASSQRNQSSASYNAQKKKHKKVIDENEGEYVDYVEIKDK
ncbi:MAG: DUF4834 family protein [Tannerella sp.]|jgi:hypothetical protein|nr:DUF4834 family protein [Tannerella sp.]